MFWSGYQPRKTISFTSFCRTTGSPSKLNNGHPRVAAQIHRLQNSKVNVCWADGYGNGAVAEISDNGNRTPPLKHPHDLTLRDQHGGVFTVLGLYPRVQLPSIPEHLPDTVAKAFREGCDVLSCWIQPKIDQKRTKCSIENWPCVKPYLPSY